MGLVSIAARTDGTCRFVLVFKAVLSDMCLELPLLVSVENSVVKPSTVRENVNAIIITIAFTFSV